MSANFAATPVERRLAERAAARRRQDIEMGRRPRGMKEYFQEVLRSQGLPINRETLQRMGAVTGRKGGLATATKRRKGLLPPPLSRKKLVQKPWFPTSLFDLSTPHYSH